MREGESLLRAKKAHLTQTLGVEPVAMEAPKPQAADVGGLMMAVASAHRTNTLTWKTGGGSYKLGTMCSSSKRATVSTVTVTYMKEN